MADPNPTAARDGATCRDDCAGSAMGYWTQVSDERLVAMYRAGDEAAFGTIHSRYQEPLLRYARGCGIPQRDTEDVVQDAFVSAQRKMRENDQTIVLAAWLHTIVHNEAVTHWRAESRQKRQVVLVRREPDPDPTADIVERREELWLLVGDVHLLPARQREALVLAACDGLDAEVIAERIGISVGAAKSYVWRARTTLRENRHSREDLGQEKLTIGQRRQRVRDLAGRGLNDRAIARTLGIRQGTVRTDRASGG